jgi:hypothetical protein
MITADQIMAHVVGDFFLQSDWMAVNKKREILPCLAHVLTYALPFLFLTTSVTALTFIIVTHFIIDHWGIMRYFIWAKNKIMGGTDSWKECSLTGYSKDRPVWLAMWLYIIVDNATHILLNGFAIWVTNV